MVDLLVYTFGYVLVPTIIAFFVLKHRMRARGFSIVGGTANFFTFAIMLGIDATLFISALIALRASEVTFDRDQIEPGLNILSAVTGYFLLSRILQKIRPVPAESSDERNSSG